MGSGSGSNESWLRPSPWAVNLIVQHTTVDGKVNLKSHMGPSGRILTGFGRLAGGNRRAHAFPSRQQALLDMKADLLQVADRLYPVVQSIAQHQFDALCCLGYQVMQEGATTLDGQDFWTSELMSQVIMGRMQLAAAEFPKWCYFGSKFSKHAYHRRLQEAALFTGA